MSNLETVEIRDNAIDVLDRPSGHTFTYHVGEHPKTGRRILSSSPKVRENVRGHFIEQVHHAIFDFAESEMLTAGKIDHRLNP